MKIAVTYENGQIFQHFGRTTQFKLYTLENEKVVAEEILDTNGSGHSALAGILVYNDVDVVICGGIGGGALSALLSVGIRAYPGVAGDPDEAVLQFLSGTMKFNPDAGCDHHDHHHGAEHECSEHGCGGNCGGCH